MMPRMNKRLKLLVHPYLFVLKEGRNIQGNFLDYNLLMLQIGTPQTIHSPNTNKTTQKPGFGIGENCAKFSGD